MKVLQESIPVYKASLFFLFFFFFPRGQKRIWRVLSSVLVEVLLIAFKTPRFYASCSLYRQSLYRISQITASRTTEHMKYWSCEAGS